MMQRAPDEQVDEDDEERNVPSELRSRPRIPRTPAGNDRQSYSPVPSQQPGGKKQDVNPQ